MRFLSAWAFVLSAGFASAAVVGQPYGVCKVANVINFVRALDPRPTHEMLVQTIDEEIGLNRKYGFPNTILLQYDAMLDDELVATVRKSDADKTEFGVWIELCKPLCESVGILWRGKKGWDWDWRINPGFLMAYEPSERERLIDAVFEKFKAVFGSYPKSVGSWLLDAHSMQYMASKYDVDGYCICREQDSTDAYGLRGGYSNGAYYPSRNNMLSAATDMKNAIAVPVFRLLTPDPIYNYSPPDKFYVDFPAKAGCPTLEPAWKSGSTPETVDWYFGCYLTAPGLINLSYLHIGQENSFGWCNIGPALAMQMARLDAQRRSGQVAVETLGDTARRFMKDHPANCPQTQVALSDWTGSGRKSIWYNCSTYRANLMLQDGRAFFRDIHVMRDDYSEPYLDSPCKGWQAVYDTPPVVDEYLFRTNGVSGVLSICGMFSELSVARGRDDRLIVTLTAPERSAVVEFSNGKVSVRNGRLEFQCPESFRKGLSFENGRLGMEWRNYRYSVGLTGDFEKTATGYGLCGDEITLDFRPKLK